MENFYGLDSEKGTKTLKKLSNSDKQNLVQIISQRISVIQKCKQNLFFKTNALIKQIEKVSNNNLKILNDYIKSWQELLIKDEYDMEELSQIRRMKQVKIIANENREFFILKEVAESFKEDPFFFVPVNNNEYQKKWEAFEKNCFKYFTTIFSTSDRSVIVTGGVDGVIRFWDRLGRVKEVYYFEQQRENPVQQIISTLALSPDLQYFVFGSNKGSITISSRLNPEIRYSHSFHLKEVTSLAISSNNQFIFSGNCEQILVSDLRLRSLKVFDNTNGLYINIKQQGTHDYFLLQNPTELLTLNLNFDTISTVKYNPNCYKNPSRYSKSGKYVVTKDNKCQVYVYRIKVPENDLVGQRINCSLGVSMKISYDIRKLNPKGNFIVGKIFISEDFKYIAFESDKVVYIWSTGQEKIINSYQLKRYQSIVNLSYEIVYLDGNHKSKGKLFSWNIISNTFTHLSELIDDTLEIFSVSSSSNKDKLVISARESIEILDNSTYTHLLSKYNNGYDTINNAILTRKNLLIIIKDKKLEGFNLNKKSDVFKVKLPFKRSNPFGILSGDESLLFVMSDKEDLSVIIDAENGNIVGIFTKRSGLSFLYSNSFDNTDIGVYLIIAFRWNSESIGEF